MEPSKPLYYQQRRDLPHTKCRLGVLRFQRKVLKVENIFALYLGGKIGDYGIDRMGQIRDLLSRAKKG